MCAIVCSNIGGGNISIDNCVSRTKLVAVKSSIMVCFPENQDCVGGGREVALRPKA